MAVGNVTITGNQSGGVGNATLNLGPFTITSNSSVAEEVLFPLAIGNNTFTVPTGTTSICIIGPNASTPAPNPVYTGVITLKGASADTGIALSNSWITEIPVASSVTSIVLSATATTTVAIWVL